jgi:hypothetical protein
MLLTTGVRSTYAGLLPRLTGHPALDVLICAIPFAASIALGLAGRRRVLPLRSLRIAVDLALLAGLALVPAQLGEVRSHASIQVIAEPAALQPQPGLAENGVPLENIYPYDARGRLLHDVRLYDQNGTALAIGAGVPDPDRRPVFNRDGARLYNAFPIRYFDPGTDRVAHPNAVPDRLKPEPLR